MLQFITKSSPRFSVSEIARKAIDGGCRWIQLSSAAFDSDIAVLKSVAEELIPYCQKADTFMVIENDVDLVDELRVHGVFLKDASRGTVASAREKLGANAVIGVAPRTIEELMNLRNLDVDYVSITPELACAITYDTESGQVTQDIASGYKALIEAMRMRGLDLHVVAAGEISPDLYPSLLEAGVAGVAVSDAIADATDPMEATRHLIELLSDARESTYR